MSGAHTTQTDRTRWDADTIRDPNEESSASIGARQAELAEGTTIGGRYRITGKIGHGGMGVVYRAHDPQLDRKVALKLLRVNRGDDRIHAERMLREAKAAAKIRHPNVVTVYDAGEVDGQVFIAMELMSGLDLGTWFEQGQPWVDVVRVMLQAAQGLRAAHEAGLVHRDFKPDNVMFEDDGNVKVLDFGLARPAYDNDTRLLVAEQLETTGVDALATLTRTGALVGTPAYMSPEQYQHEPLDARTDQFSFCVALYKGVYGQLPFFGRSYGALMMNIINGNLQEPEDPSIAPARLLVLLRRGLAPVPDDRFESIDALIVALQDLLEREGRRRGLPGGAARWLLPGIGLAVAAGVIGLSLAKLGRGPIDEQTTEARAVTDAGRDSDTSTGGDSVAGQRDEDPALPVELAAGNGRDKPVDGPEIRIAPDVLRVVTAAAGSPRDIPLPAATSEAHTIPPLVAALEPARAEGVDARYDPVTLYVDRRIPFATVERVIYSGGQAGFARYDFAVRADGQTRVFETRPPIFFESEVRLRRRFALELLVRGDRVQVGARVWAPNDHGPPDSPARWSLDAGAGSCELMFEPAGLEPLGELGAELCALDGVSIPVIVGAEDDVAWEQVAAVLSAAQPSVECSRGIVIVAEMPALPKCATPVAVAQLDSELERAAAGSAPEPEFRRWCFINSRLKSKKVCRDSKQACIAEARHWVSNPGKRCKGER